MPALGAERREALSALMLAIGTVERAMTANGEQRRPPEQMSRERFDRLRRYCRQGFETLDRQVNQRGWLVGERMLLPDVTAAVGFSFVNRVHPGLLDERQLPAIAALAGRCEAMPAFKAAWIDVDP
jgi:glutathione S-transferase